MVGLCLWGFYLVRVKDSQHRLVALNFFMLNLTRDLQFLLRLPFPAQPCIHHTQVVMSLAESWLFGDCLFKEVGGRHLRLTQHLAFEVLFVKPLFFVVRKENPPK